MITTLEGQSVWVTQEPTLQEVISGNYTLPVNFKVVDATTNTYKTVSYVFDSVNGARRLESGGGSVSGDSYSTDEIKTGGTWVDGRPIYRKVFIQDINFNQNSEILIQTGITDFGDIISTYGNIKSPDQEEMWSLDSLSPIDFCVRFVEYEYNGVYLYFKDTNNIQGTFTISIALEYTRHTDTSSLPNPE